MRPRRWVVPLSIAAFAHVAIAAVPVVVESAATPEPNIVRVRFNTPPPPEPPEPEPPEPEPPEPEPEPPEPEPEPVRPRRAEPVTESAEPEPEPPKPPEPAAAQNQDPTPSRPEPATPVEPQQREPEQRAEPQPVGPPKPAGGTADMRGYGTGVYKDMLAHQRYPPAARRLGLEGRGKVLVRIDRRGRLVGKPSIADSTGHEVLDQEALAMVERAAPFLALPKEFDKDVATLVIPVRFQIKSAR